MPARSNPDRYGSIAILIHWTSAVLIVGMLASGLRVADLTDPAAKITLLRVHAVAGVAVLALTLLRIVWWWRFDRKPTSVAGTPIWQHRLAHAVHGILYAIILGMAASGIGMIALSGAGDILFGGAAGPLPDFLKYAPRLPHGLGARLLMALLALHVAAALYHHFVRRDATLRRMWFGRTAG